MLNRKTISNPFVVFVLGTLVIVFVNTPHILVDFGVALATFIIINRGISLPAVSRLRIIFVAFIAFAIDLAWGAFSPFEMRFTGACFGYFVLDTLLLIKYQEKPKHVFLLATAPILLLYSLVAYGIAASEVPLVFSPLIGLAFAILGSKAWGQWWRFFRTGACLFAITVIGFPNYRGYHFGKTTNVLDDRSGFRLVDRNGDTLSLNDIQSKVIVLDFWYSRCGICFREFPSFEKIAKHFERDEVFFATVFVPDNEEEEASDTWYYAVNEYAVNHFKATDNMTSNNWRIPAYPYILIFDNSKKLRYEGFMNKNSFINNPKLIVKSLLKEAASPKKELAANAASSGD